jgi:hypothetical protein
LASLAVSHPQSRLICDFLLKFAGVLTTVSIAIATVGIPIELPFAKDLRELFPCMNCGCGCVNAEMCWRDCCCFTNAQKLAWAQENGVQAPAFLLEQVAVETLQDSQLADLKPCCRKRALAARQAASCSRDNANCDSESESDSQEDAPGIIAINALKCQGNSLSLSLLPPSIPTDEIGTDLPLLPGEEVFVAENLFYLPPCFDAVVPPPEFAVL